MNNLKVRTPKGRFISIRLHTKKAHIMTPKAPAAVKRDFLSRGYTFTGRRQS